MNKSNYGPWLVVVGKLNGKPVDYALQVDAGSAREARAKAKDLGYTGIGKAWSAS
jgi:hypothetical protein